MCVGRGMCVSEVWQWLVNVCFCLCLCWLYCVCVCTFESVCEILTVCTCVDGGDGLLQTVCIVCIALLMFYVYVHVLASVCVYVSCVLSSSVRHWGHLSVSVQMGGWRSDWPVLYESFCVCYVHTHTPVFSIWVLCESLCVFGELS